jgi:hypothetical protein
MTGAQSVGFSENLGCPLRINQAHIAKQLTTVEGETIDKLPSI